MYKTNASFRYSGPKKNLCNHERRCKDSCCSGGAVPLPVSPEDITGDSGGSEEESLAGSSSGTRCTRPATILRSSALPSRSSRSCSRRCSISEAILSTRRSRSGWTSSARPSTCSSTRSSTRTYRRPSSPVSKGRVPRFARLRRASVVVPIISAAVFKSTHWPPDRVPTRLPSIYLNVHPESTRETSPLLALLMGGVRLAENSTPNVARRLCVGEEHLLEGQRPSGSPECVFLQLESLEPPALAQNVQPEEPWLWQHTRGLKQNGAFHRQQLAGSATRSVLHFVTGEWLSGVL